MAKKSAATSPPVTGRLRRRLTNALIVAFLALTFIDTYPGPWPIWARLQAAADPILDLTGLWQGPWSLYAPNVDQENHHLEMIAHFSDGEIRTWRSPDWTGYSCLETFLSIREIEYFDRVREKSNFSAWPTLADYARREWLQPSNLGAELVRIEILEQNRPLADLRLPPYEVPEPSEQTFHIEQYGVHP